MSSVSATFADGLRRVKAVWREFVAIPNLWVVLLFVLAVDLVAFSRMSRWHVPLLGIGCHTCAFGGSTFTPRNHAGTIIEQDGQFRVVSQHHPDFQAMRDKAVASFHYFPRSSSIGLSAPVMAFDHNELRIGFGASSGSVSLTVSEARSLVIDALASEDVGWRPVASERIAALRAGEVTRVRMSLGWLLHDIAYVVLAWACIVSARAAAAELNAKSGRGDLCPACGYATADLRAKGITHCPECGHLQSL